jgi:hypothetical protein
MPLKGTIFRVVIAMSNIHATYENGVEKSNAVALIVKHRLAVVATIDHVIHKPIVNRSQRTRHGDRLLVLPLLRKR